jgi:hypothetical protein
MSLHYENPAQCVDILQSERISSLYRQNVTFSHHDIAIKQKWSSGIKQQILTLLKILKYYTLKMNSIRTKFSVQEEKDGRIRQVRN